MLPDNGAGSFCGFLIIRINKLINFSSVAYLAPEMLKR